MNHQPFSHTARNLNAKESKMHRRIVAVLFALFAALVLSACAVQSPFQTAGSVTVLPKIAGPAISSPQVNDRQQLADYQASLSSIVPVAAVPKAVAAVNDTQISSRQQLADYQASLPLYTGKTFAAVTTVQQIADRQELAEYQATLR